MANQMRTLYKQVDPMGHLNTSIVAHDSGGPLAATDAEIDRGKLTSNVVAALRYIFHGLYRDVVNYHATTDDNRRSSTLSSPKHVSASLMPGVLPVSANAKI